MAAWDMDNKAFEDSGGAYRKDSLWYAHMGKAYIEKAFRYAHEADSGAALFYNDLGMGGDTAKLNGILAMAKEFKIKHVLIDGLGFQMHIQVDAPDKGIAYALKKAAATGLKIHISELDISFNAHGKVTYTDLMDDMLQAQSEKYRKIVEMYREYVPRDQQFGITFWDFNNREAWIRSFVKVEDGLPFLTRILIPNRPIMVLPRDWPKSSPINLLPS